MNHKKKNLVLITFLLISQFAFSNENNAVTIKNLSIQIMPEHDFPSQWPKDTPSLLVGYYGSFINKTTSTLSKEVVLELPLDHPNFKINMICDTEKGMVCLPFKLNRDNNTVTWNLSRSLNPGEEVPFMVEYYSSPFEPVESKSFKLSPVFNSDINKVTVDISQPAGSSEFLIKPAPLKTINQNGANHSYIYYDNLEAGKIIDIAISYIKPDNNGSAINNNTINSSNFQPATAKGTVSDSTFFIAVIISAAVAFLGLMIYLSSRNQAAAAQRNGKKNHSKNGKKDSSEAEKNKIRKLLIDGKISEKTYKQLLKDIPGSRS